MIKTGSELQAGMPALPGHFRGYKMSTENHKDTRVKRYNNTKLVLGITGFVLQMAFLQIVLLTGFSDYVASHSLRWIPNAYIAMLIYVVIIGVIDGALFFPLDLYSGFIMEHKYSLSNQTFAGWLWDELKGVLVSFFVMLVPLLLALYYCIRRFGNLWWLPVAGVVFFFTVILSELAPVLIMPLFYKFSPIEDEELGRRLTRLVERLGLRVRGVFSFNMSKNTKKANAALTGLRRTRRIILSDTLLHNFSTDEIESVFAHELGHHKYRHIWKGIAVGVISTFAGSYLVAQLYELSLGIYALRGIDDIAALPLLGIFLGLFGLIVMPAGNLMSRHYERQADRYSIQEMGKEAFISAMNRLEEINLGDRTPHRIVEFLFYSHPSIGKRIDMAEKQEGA